MKKTLGVRIRELRDQRDLSLREFARRLGDVSAAHLSDIELGRRYRQWAIFEVTSNEQRLVSCADFSVVARRFDS